MKLIVSEPSTFFSFDKNILVYDQDGHMFYMHPNDRKSILFNLPMGVFYTENNLLKQKEFQPYEKFRGWNLKFNPKEFTTVLKPNKNKATINTFFKTITVDPSIPKYNYAPLLDFVIGHELGHLEVGGNKYDDNKNLIFDAEKACDEISRNYMLSHGWNPSQIKLAAELLLRSGDRRECIHNNTVGKYNLR